MANDLNILSWDPEHEEPTRVTPSPGAHAVHMPKYGANLFPCQDCGHYCSRRAEHCPQCGRFFQRFDSAHAVTVDKRGWVWTIAGGIWWAAVFPWLLVLVIVVVLLLVGVGGFALVPQR